MAGERAGLVQILNDWERILLKVDQKVEEV